MYYIKVRDLDTRQRLIGYLKEREINSVFHYVPLHSSIAGRKFGRFHGDDNYTTTESDRLLRLPMHNELQPEDVDRVVECIRLFFQK